MTLKEFYKKYGVSVLFDHNTKTYPAPFETKVKAELIARATVRDFGGLKMREDFEDIDDLVYDEIMLNADRLAMYNKIVEDMAILDTVPSRVIEKQYGIDVTTLNYGAKSLTDSYGATSSTMNIGARSTTDNLGAQHSSTQETDTSYETTTGKNTKGTTTDVNAIVNGSSQAAASDSTSTTAHSDTHSEAARMDSNSRAAHSDTENIYNNVSADTAAEDGLKWAELATKPIMRVYEQILLDSICIPYYE